MKKTNKHTSLGIALGMCFGVSLGSSFGLINDNLSLGISMGLCFGMAIGVAIGANKDNLVNKQLEEKGYTIQSIEENEEKQEYIITILSKDSEEIVVPVTKTQMKAAAFKVDDVVYLNEAGQIEQVYNS